MREKVISISKKVLLPLLIIHVLLSWVPIGLEKFGDNAFETATMVYEKADGEVVELEMDYKHYAAIDNSVIRSPKSFMMRVGYIAFILYLVISSELELIDNKGEDAKKIPDTSQVSKTHNKTRRKKSKKRKR